MDINRENLDTVFRGLRKDFQGALNTELQSAVLELATNIQSSTASERFDWLGDFPEMREWVGERVAHQLASYNYEVFPKEWEVTLRMLRKDILDDRIGLYSARAKALGKAAARLKPREISNALQAGTTRLCYDGQPMFDTEHPVGEDGDITLVSNYLNAGGASAATPWYVADLSQMVKPILTIDREPAQFQQFADWSNLHTFKTKEFLMGAYARMGTGYGLWQSIVRNEAAMNIDNLMATRYAMSQFTGHKKNEDGDRRLLGVNGSVIICGRSLEERAKLCLAPTAVSRTDPFAVAASNAVNPAAGLFRLIVVDTLP